MIASSSLLKLFETNYYPLVKVCSNSISAYSNRVKVVENVKKIKL